MRMQTIGAVTALSLALGAAAPAQAGSQMDYGLTNEEQAAPALPEVRSMRERAQILDTLLEERLETLVPAIMREHGYDMWVLVAREYLEDPVVSTMLNATSRGARRRTILVFFDPGEGEPIERLTVSRYGMGDLFESAWNPEEQGDDQWAPLAQIIEERDPSRIAINSSALTAFGDGMTLSQYEGMVGALPRKYKKRVEATEALAVHWLETRTPSEMEYYPEVVRLAHAIIAEGFSSEVVTPGETTVDDLRWWYRQRIRDLGVLAWFHPNVNVHRKGEPEALTGDTVIQPGDMLWNDFGITYLRLNTDTQHLAYVLKEGETDVPAGLRAGMAANNKVQDALTSSFEVGLTGNEVLARARKKAIDQELVPSIYTHPIGYHGHAAGPSIGFWDNQGPSEKGGAVMRPNTAWSIELNATVAVPEWDGQLVPFKSEEDAFFDGETVTYIDGRQTSFHLIGK
jgi:Xaa-Pro aminopeptidase